MMDDDDVLAVSVEILYATFAPESAGSVSAGESGNDLEPNLFAEPAKNQNHHKFNASL